MVELIALVWERLAVIRYGSGVVERFLHHTEPSAGEKSLLGNMKDKDCSYCFHFMETLDNTFSVNSIKNCSCVGLNVH